MFQNDLGIIFLHFQVTEQPLNFVLQPIFSSIQAGTAFSPLMDPNYSLCPRNFTDFAIVDRLSREARKFFDAGTQSMRASLADMRASLADTDRDDSEDQDEMRHRSKYSTVFPAVQIVLAAPIT